ncbi:hypothetical protein BX616_008938, partial [Lobosporangium transversale]
IQLPPSYGATHPGVITPLQTPTHEPLSPVSASSPMSPMTPLTPMAPPPALSAMDLIHIDESNLPPPLRRHSYHSRPYSHVHHQQQQQQQQQQQHQQQHQAAQMFGCDPTYPSAVTFMGQLSPGSEMAKPVPMSMSTMSIEYARAAAAAAPSFATQAIYPQVY